MTKEELLSNAAAAATTVFNGTKIFVPTGWDKGEELTDDTNVSRLASIEAGKSYLIISVVSAATTEVLKPEDLAKGKSRKKGDLSLLI